MARKLKKVENETHTLQELEYSERTDQKGKQKLTLQDLEYGEKTDKRGKCETHVIGHEILRETLKNLKIEKCTLQDMDYGEKTEKRVK